MKIVGLCPLLFVSLALTGCQQEAPVAEAETAIEEPGAQQQVATDDSAEQSEAKVPGETEANSVDKGDTPKVASKEILIDVRSQEEWESGHLRDAVWIPHTDIAERIAEVTEDKSAKLVLY